MQAAMESELDRMREQEENNPRRLKQIIERLQREQVLALAITSISLIPRRSAIASADATRYPLVL